MLAGSSVANVSDSPMGSTCSNQEHSINRQDGYTYTFWDTPGCNESEHGTLPSQAAAQNLQSLVMAQPVDLLIYCIRSRLVDMIRVNYELVSKTLHKESVPIVLVVTGLENRNDMDEWWRDNEKTIKKMKMSFDGHACITSSKGKNNVYEKEYKESAEKVWALVVENCGPRHNVIVFGESGCGKSSLVNMIVGKDVAKVSSSLTAFTFKNHVYKAHIDDKLFFIYDTAGLNDGEQGRVPRWEAVRELYTLIRQLNGVSLLVFCMRGELRENTKANWTLFHKVICGGNVPIIVVVTGLDAYKSPDDWWKDEGNQKVFEKNGIKPNEVGCIVSIPGPNGEYKEVYRESRDKLRRLIVKHQLQKPWGEDEKDKWFCDIYQNVYQQDLCLIRRNKMEYSQQMRDTIGQFVQEAGDDAEKLVTTLLQAEKKFRKPRFFTLW